MAGTKAIILLYAVFQSFGASAVFAGQKPPEGLKLGSALYELARAEDKEKFAARHGIILSDEKVKVFIYLNPASTEKDKTDLIKKYDIAAEKTSGDLMRALVKVSDLIGLSKEPAVSFINLPAKPVKHKGQYDAK